jgi:hypothetical protein
MPTVTWESGEGAQRRDRTAGAEVPHATEGADVTSGCSDKLVATISVRLPGLVALGGSRAIGRRRSGRDRSAALWSPWLIVLLGDLGHVGHILGRGKTSRPRHTPLGHNCCRLNTRGSRLCIRIFHRALPLGIEAHPERPADALKVSQVYYSPI